MGTWEWELLPFLNNCYNCKKIPGKIFDTCVQSILPYGGERCIQRNEDELQVEKNDQVLLRWICGGKPSGKLIMDFPYKCSAIVPFATLQRSSCLGMLPVVKAGLTCDSVCARVTW